MPYKGLLIICLFESGLLYPLVKSRRWGRRLRATEATGKYLGAPPRRRENSGLGCADRLSEVPLVLLSSLSLSLCVCVCKMKAALSELGSVLRLRRSLEKELRNSRWWHILRGRAVMLVRTSDIRGWGAPSGGWLSLDEASTLAPPFSRDLKGSQEDLLGSLNW